MFACQFPLPQLVWSGSGSQYSMGPLGAPQQISHQEFVDDELVCLSNVSYPGLSGLVQALNLAWALLELSMLLEIYKLP